MSCAQCGARFEVQHQRGRPRKYCDQCRVRGYERVTHPRRGCAESGVTFTPASVRSRFCSDACRYRARDRARGPGCSACGKQMWGSKEIADIPTCHTCRRQSPAYRIPGPKPTERWNCGLCGATCERSATKGQRPKYCQDCRVRDWISPARRLALYERDSWTCWLCEEAVDASLIGTRSEWRPSLDHVTPRSRGGTHDDSNLRLAHMWCNCVRSDDKHAPEVFRVSA